MQKFNIISLQSTKNQDHIIKICSNDLAEIIRPGNVVEISLSAKGNAYCAVFFSCNKKNGELTLFLSHKHNLSIDNQNKDIYLAEISASSFTIEKEDKKIVLFADEKGLPAIFFLADRFVEVGRQPLLFLCSNEEFPFQVKPSHFVIDNLPLGMLATCQLLEDKKIPARLISETGLPGCYDGSVKEFLEELNLNGWDFDNADFRVAGSNKFVNVVNSFAHCESVVIE